MSWVYSWGGEGQAGVFGYIPGVVRVGLVSWVYSWGGGGRAGVLGIFLGWWGSGW